MAKKKSAMPKKKAAKSQPRDRVSRVVDQVKEPLSLLNTLKEEGLANAMTLIGIASSVASGATKNFRPDLIKPQLLEMVGSLGFARIEDLERLEARVEELEAKLSEKEFEAIRASDEE